VGRGGWYRGGKPVGGPKGAGKKKTKHLGDPIFTRTQEKVEKKEERREKKKYPGKCGIRK